MKILGFQFGKEIVQEVKEPNYTSHSLAIIKPKGPSNVPLDDEQLSNGKYITFGIDDLFPQQLINLFQGSALHASCITQRARFIAGSGIEFDSQDSVALKLLEQPNQWQNLQDLIDEISLDQSLFGAYALELTWDLSKTKIISIKRVTVEGLRSGDLIDGKVVTFYHYPIFNSRRRNYQETIYNAYDPKSNNRIELLYVPNKIPGQRFYGMPHYISGLQLVEASGNISVFINSLINNGFSPSMIVKLFRDFASREDADTYIRQMVKSYSSASNAGKAMVLTSSSKENSPEIVFPSGKGMADMFLSVEESINRSIVMAHSAVPEIFNLQVAGGLNSSEISQKYSIFLNNVIFPNQEKILRTFNNILKLNGSTSKMKIVNKDFFSKSLI